MNSKKKSKSEVEFIIHCLIIPLVSFAVFYLYVNAKSILMAFQTREGQWTLEHFIRFYKDVTEPGAAFNIALRNTLLTFGINVLSFPFKVLVSYFIYKKIPFYGFYRVVFFLPGIIFSVAQAFIFSRMIDPTSPIAEAVGNWLGMGGPAMLLEDSRFANITILLHMMWMNFPGDLVIWGGTFARIPNDVLESAEIDGAGWWKQFTHVIVPMVWPTVSLQMILLSTGVFSASGAVFLLTGGEYGTETIASWQYKYLLNNVGNFETSNIYNYLSAAGLVLTFIAITISLIIRKYIDKAFDDVEY